MNTTNSLLALFITVLVGFHPAGLAAAADIDNRSHIELAQVETPPKTGTKITLQEILDKYYEARGGEQAWEKIETLKFTGAMHTEKAVFNTAAVYKRPDRCRLDFQSGRIYFVEAFNGQIPWQMNPGMRTGPHIMKGKRAKEMIDTCDFEGPLINSKKKGHTIEYLGEQTVDGRTAYVLEVTLNTGNIDTYYLDPETFLPFMVRGTTTIQEQTVNTEVKLDKYLEIDGIIVPFDYEFIVDGNPLSETLEIRTIELNKEIEDHIFNLPKRPRDLR